MFLKETEIKKENFLKDKHAVIYFSTTADQDMYGDGKGFIVFSDKDGKTSTIKTKGLELGNVTTNGEQLLIEDANKITFIGDKYREFPYQNPQHTGERSGFLSDIDTFYTLFNSGFDDKGGYKSDIYWGNQTNIRNDTIPNYILASGQDTKFLYIVTNEIKKPEAFSLKRISLNNKMEIKEIKKWQDAEDNTIISNIISDKNDVYFVQDIMKNQTKGKFSSQMFFIKIDQHTHTKEKY